jgi:Peptidase family M23
MNSHFIWPLSKRCTPDEMNTSFGPRIDANRWDFHDGIDLPARLGTPVYAMAGGLVHRAGPADKTGPGQGFGSRHVLLQVLDPTDGKDDLFLVHLHLDAIAEGVIAGAQVNQCDLIGTVGQEDASYPHLHFEFRKGGPEQSRSVHPLNYLPYFNMANFTQLHLDKCNFYRDDGNKRAVRLRFAVRNRKEGDLQGVRVELRDGISARELRINFDDRETINSDKGDEHAFKNGIAVEGYQKSNLKGERLRDLQYGVIVKDITPEYETVKLEVLDVRNEKGKSAEFALPKLEAGEEPVNSRVGFEDETFPPQGWELKLLPGNICLSDEDAAHVDSRGMLCQDLRSLQGPLIRSGLRFALPPRRMSWRLRADIRPTELEMSKGQLIHALAFLLGDNLLAAACLRKIRNDRYVAGVLIGSVDGLLRERINVEKKVEILPDSWVRWELDLIRLGSRQTTAVLQLDGNEVARINGDTTGVEPDAGCVGILHRHGGLQISLHVDQLRLTEAPR